MIESFRRGEARRDEARRWDSKEDPQQMLWQRNIEARIKINFYISSRYFGGSQIVWGIYIYSISDQRVRKAKDETNMDTTNSHPRTTTKQESSPLVSVEISEIIPCEDKTLGQRIWGHVKHNSLLILTLVGVIVGFGIGFGVRTSNPSDTALMWIGKDPHEEKQG